MDYEGEAFEQFCQENNIVINIQKNLGTRIRGFCYYDGYTYHVILNNRFSTEQLKKTMIHEIIHVMENHFDCDVKDFNRCEEEVRLIIGKMRLSFA